MTTYISYYLMGIILLPGIILALWAQSKVSSTYTAYSKVAAKSGITASELIKKLLSAANIQGVSVIKVSGNLTDYFDSQKKVLALSDSVYNSSSIAALGVACHEFGHVMQWHKKYAPLKIRQALIPITNFASRLLFPLIFIGIIFNFGAYTLAGDIFLWAGVILFGLSVLVSLATLPVEYNASKQAIKILQKSNTLDSTEIVGAKKVLSAASLTYLAALILSVLSLLRFLLAMLFSRRRN